MNEIKIADLERGLSIDANAIDEALLNQPDLFYRVAKQLALLISQRDAIKQEKEEIEAEVDAKIRSEAAANADDKDKKKLTEKEVESRKALSEEVRAIEREYLDLGERVNKIVALKEAYIQRSHALKSLVELHISGYFGTNVASSESRMKDYDADKARKAMSRERVKRGQ